MKGRSLLLLLLVFLLSVIALGKDKVLKPDREISITSVERRDSGKPYRVNAQTPNLKTRLHYRLACGTGAADLEVGRVYPAQEITTEGNKSLVIGNVGSEGIVILCDVESVKDN
jgi:hypothetical protein